MHKEAETSRLTEYYYHGSHDLRELNSMLNDTPSLKYT